MSATLNIMVDSRICNDKDQNWTRQENGSIIRILQKLFMSLGFILLFQISASAMGLSLKINKNAEILSNDIYEIFIENKICTNKMKDCTSKELLFFDGSTDTLYIYIFSIDNMKVVNEIIQVCTDRYSKEHKDFSIDLSFYNISMKEKNKRGSIKELFNKSSFLEFKLKGEIK